MIGLTGGGSIPKSWGVEGENTLKAMISDSDKDGRTDYDELCKGAMEANPNCVKTDPNKRDTNDNGWWDGINIGVFGRYRDIK